MKRIAMTTIALAMVTFSGCETSGGDADFERGLCQDACDRANFAGANCYDAPTLTACRDACLRRSVADAESFDSCASGARGSGAGVGGIEEDCPAFVQCLDILDVAPSSGGTNGASNSTNGSMSDSALCKTNCDHVATECEEATAGSTADCKASCDASGGDAIDSFNACVDSNRFICSDGSLLTCYDHLGVIW